METASQGTSKVLQDLRLFADQSTLGSLPSVPTERQRSGGRKNYPGWGRISSPTERLPRFQERYTSLLKQTDAHEARLRPTAISINSGGKPHHVSRPASIRMQSGFVSCANSRSDFGRLTDHLIGPYIDLTTALRATRFSGGFLFIKISFLS